MNAGDSLIPAALMNDRFLEREPMCSAQRPSPLGPINSQGAWYNCRRMNNLLAVT